jgi:hypothetical protein
MHEDEEKITWSLTITDSNNLTEIKQKLHNAVTKVWSNDCTITTRQGPFADLLKEPGNPECEPDECRCVSGFFICLVDHPIKERMVKK